MKERRNVVITFKVSHRERNLIYELSKSLGHSSVSAMITGALSEYTMNRGKTSLEGLTTNRK